MPLLRAHLLPLLLLLIPLAWGASMSPKINQKKTPASLVTQLEQNCPANPKFIPKKMDSLGKGFFATVYKEEFQGNVVALKELCLRDEDDPDYLEFLVNELSLLKLIQKENGPSVLLRLHGCYLRESSAWHEDGHRWLGLAMELLEGMDLQKAILKWVSEKKPTTPPFTEPVIAKVMASVLQGLIFLHERGWLHRDVKAANIVITQEGHVKLIDYGLSRPLDSQVNGSCSKGYAAPELLMGMPHGIPHDSWCLASTAFEMHTGFMAIYLIPDVAKKLEDFITKGELPTLMNKHFYPKLKDHLTKASAGFRDFILITLQSDPNSRPTPENLLKHEFLQGPMATPEQLMALVLEN